MKTVVAVVAIVAVVTLVRKILRNSEELSPREAAEVWTDSEALFAKPLSV